MNLRRDNRIVVDLNKCQFARFYYRNQSSQVLDTLLSSVTWMGQVIDERELALFHPSYPNETVVERMKRRGIQPDIWVPEVLFKLSANHCLIYTGEKAVSLWKAWGERIFKKTKKG